MMVFLFSVFATIGIGTVAAALALGVYRLASDFVDAHVEGLEFRIARHGVSITGHDEILTSHAKDIRHLTESNNQLVEYGRETRKDSEDGFGALTLEIADIRERIAMIERTLAA